MGKLMQKLLGKNKRQKLTIAAVAFILYVLALSGIFSYFQGSDAVTNTLRSVITQNNDEEGSVTIQEPRWVASGKDMAEKIEPGMQIDKDPSGVNDGGIDLYVRLKMTVSFEEYAGALKKNASALTSEEIQNGEIGIPSDDDRMKAIINAVKLVDQGVASPFLMMSGSDWICQNPSFFCEPGTSAERSYVFYFYYKDSATGNMKSVPPNGSTAELFQRVDIPIYKREYLGVFDQPFTITVQAEGIPVGSDTSMTVEQARNRFESE